MEPAGPGSPWAAAVMIAVALIVMAGTFTMLATHWGW